MTAIVDPSLGPNAAASSNGSTSSSKLTPVYVKCPQHAWIPAALVEQSKDGSTASVILPTYKNEHEMLEINLEELEELQNGWKTQPHVTQIDLQEYENGILPLQNINTSNTARKQGELMDYNDMVDVSYLHEAAILYNLKHRHVMDKPYTRTGDIMIALNPYQWLENMYTDETRIHYAQELIWKVSDRDARTTLEPHIYEVAALSYKGMAVDGYDQSILVSGESGAGKTETVKIAMNFIASVHTTQQDHHHNVSTTAANNNADDKSPASCNTIVQRILDSSPMLEAFGNAKTRRNDNSSRFGKYTQLQLDRLALLPTASAQLAGSTCEVYLLEKNRVVAHDAEERTFHIFYQLLAAPEDVKAQIWESGLPGTTNDSFAYVGASTTNTIEGKTDAERFQLVTQALNLLGIQGESWLALMRSICIVLQLGNIGFQADPGNEDASQIATQTEFQGLAELMGISEEDLTSALTKRTFLARGELCTVLLNAAQAKDSCHALAKEVYGRSFLWLVRAINKATCAENNYTREGENSGTPESYGLIGLLDIFGFESFDTNRFEQICINYANEKLQQKFTEDIFRSVQKEYVEEGLDLADIVYNDNAAILKLIEGRAGILDLLNEECMLPKSNPENFVRKVGEQHKASPHLIMDPLDKVTFRIHHYAGPVEYLTDNFIELNRDTLPQDLRKCAATSTNLIIAQEFSSGVLDNGMQENSGRTAPKRGKSGMSNETLSSRYRNQLSDLMKDLRKTQSRYIRCIKPNTLKKPRILEHQTTVEQLRYAGIIAGIMISRSAFPNRLPNTTVLARYKTMWNKKKFPSKAQINASDEEKQREDCIAMLTGLLQHMETKDKNGDVVKAFVVGKTKSYFRGGALEYLQSQRLNAFDSLAATIQTVVRAWIIRNRYRERRQRAHEHRLEMQVYQDEITLLTVQLELGCDDEVAALEKRAEEAETKIKEYQRKIEVTQKCEAMKIQEEYEEMQKILDEKHAEEDRLRKLNEHISSACNELEKKAEVLRAENKRLEDEAKVKNDDTQKAKSGNKSYNKLRQDLTRYEQQNKEMEREVKKKKLQQMQAEKQRYDERTKLRRLVDFIRCECQNDSLVEEVLNICRALDARTQATVDKLPK